MHDAEQRHAATMSVLCMIASEVTEGWRSTGFSVLALVFLATMLLSLVADFMRKRSRRRRREALIEASGQADRIRDLLAEPDPDGPGRSLDEWRDLLGVRRGQTHE